MKSFVGSLGLVLLATAAPFTSAFMLPATRLAFQRGANVALARPPASRRMIARTLAMAANPKVKSDNA